MPSLEFSVCLQSIRCVASKMRPDVIFCAEGSAFITVYIFIHNINISTYAHQIFPHSLANAIFKNASMLHLLRWLRWRAQSGLLWAPWGSGRDLRYPSRVRALLGPGPTPQKENTNQEFTKKSRRQKIDTAKSTTTKSTNGISMTYVLGWEGGTQASTLDC